MSRGLANRFSTTAIVSSSHRIVLLHSVGARIFPSGRPGVAEWGPLALRNCHRPVHAHIHGDARVKMVVLEPCGRIHLRRPGVEDSPLTAGSDDVIKQ